MTNSIHSTDDLNHGKFRPHGRVEHEVKGNILWTTAVGPFNSELLEALTKLTLDLLPALATKGPWGNVCTFKHSALGSADVLARLADLVKQAVQANMAAVCVAFVLPPEVEGADLMRPLYAKCYEDAGVRFDAFPNVELASRWVESVLGQAAQ